MPHPPVQTQPPTARTVVGDMSWLEGSAVTALKVAMRPGMFEFATRTQRLHHSDHNHRPMWLIGPALSVLAPTYR